MIKVCEIKIAEKKDIPHVLYLGKRIKEIQLSNSGWHTYEDIESWIENPKAVLLLASKDLTLVGFAYGLIEEPSTACLVYIGVLEKYRKQGVGESLFNSWLATISEHKPNKLYVMATSENSQLFFSKLGFDWGSALIYMEKNIQCLTETQESQP